MNSSPDFSRLPITLHKIQDLIEYIENYANLQVEQTFKETLLKKNKAFVHIPGCLEYVQNLSYMVLMIYTMMKDTQVSPFESLSELLRGCEAELQKTSSNEDK